MAKYPTVTAGTRITAALLESLLPDEAYKASGTTRTSTTTLADDPDLTLTLEANAVYKVEFHLHYAAIDAADIKTAWTVPSGATGVRSAVGADADVVLDATAGGQGRFGVHAYTTVVQYGTRNSATNQCWALEESIVTTTSAGTCAIQWAQVTSDATGSTMSAGSYMRVKRLA